MRKPLQTLLDLAERLAARAWFRPHALARPVRLAVFGSGKAAAYHLKALSRIGQVRVTCIVNRGRTDPTGLMRQYGIPAWHRDPAAALAKPDFDAALVAVPPPATHGVATALVRQGIPCLVEKPLGATLAEAQALEALIHQQGARVAVGYNRRFYGCVLDALAWCGGMSPYAIHIDAPEHPTARRIAGDPARAGEYRDWLLANTTHALDLFTLFMGPYADVARLPYPKTRNGIAVDFMGFLRFRQGGAGTFVSHWNSPGDWTAELYAEDRRCSVNLHRNTASGAPGCGFARARRHAADFCFKPGVYRQDCAFLDAVAAGAPPPPPLATATDARICMQMAGEMLHACGATV